MADIRELLDALGPAGLGLDGEQLAEALWLARAISDGAPEPEEAGGGSPEPSIPPELAAHTAPTAPGPAVPVSVPGTGGAETSAERSAGIGAVGVPRVPAVVAKTTVLGELRPLARRTTTPRLRVFDEELTVERTAATEVRWPVTRPGELRERELCLVLDRDPAMAAWEGLAEEVRELFAAVGGFRRIAVRYSETGRDGELRLAEAAYAPATEPLCRLRDPSGRRIVVMLTTALGDAWVRGTAARDLARLAESVPVAVAQPLPAMLWRRTGLDWGYGRIAPRAPGRPGPLRVLDADAARGRTLTPVPVFELAKGWLGPWARAVAGDGSQARYPLLRRSAAADGPTLADLQDLELDDDPEEQVRVFRSASSPEAYRLAVLLSVVGLNPPVMRLIQSAVMPGSSPSVLAEVIAGGLVEPAERDTRERPVHAADEARRVFVFRQRVGEVLRRALRRSDSLSVLALASKFVEERYDVPGHVFEAAVSRPQAGDGGLPFAYLSVQTLQRIAASFPSTGGGVDEAELLAFCRDALPPLPPDPDEMDGLLHRGRRLLEAVPVGDARREDVLGAMIDLLSRRWRMLETDDPAGLDEAIALAKASLAEILEPRARGERLVRLVDLLRERFRVARETDFLVEAARMLRAALALDFPDSIGDWRFEQTELLGDIATTLGVELGEPIYLGGAEDLYGECARGYGIAISRAISLLKSVRARLYGAELVGALSEAVEHRVLAEFRQAFAEADEESFEFRRLDLLVQTLARSLATQEIAHEHLIPQLDSISRVWRYPGRGEPPEGAPEAGQEPTIYDDEDGFVDDLPPADGE